MPRDPLGPPPGSPPIGLDALARRALRGWLLLAVGALAAAGALALLLALSRTPVVQDWLPWPWQDFFQKALVTHVVFAFVIWFLAMLGGLAAAARPSGRVSLVGLALSVIGFLMILTPALTNQGKPSLSNYIPVLIHPLFLGGLGLFALGVLLPVLRLLLRPPAWGGTLALGVGTAGLLYLMALACFVMAWTGLQKPVTDRPDLLFWGGGHVLQFAYTALLLTGWQVLGTQTFGQPPLAPRPWRLVCFLLALGGLAGPVLYTVYDAASPELRQGFTRLYWIALPIPILLTGVAAIERILRGPRDWHSPAFLGLALSVGLFAVGGFLGAFADGTDTRTPAHYHAEIGGVNLAFMGVIFAVLLPALLRGGGGKAERWQFWLYGAGQTLFSLGMFVAGSEGVPRKVAGAAQGLDTVVKTAGMAATGAGGLMAVAGGALFVWMTLSRLLSSRQN